MDVCGRATRGQSRDDAVPHRERQKQLARAERLLNDIGHLEVDQATPDQAVEARALCAWLENRERATGVARPSRRGREYQQRLRLVVGFLTGVDPIENEAEVQPESEEPPTEMSEQNPSEVLWGRAMEIARQHGEAGNDAYIEAIFRRLVSGVTDG